MGYTQRNLFKILLNQTEIRLYLPYSDWFGAADGRSPFAVPNQSGNGKYNLISGWFNKIFEKIYLWYHWNPLKGSLRTAVHHSNMLTRVLRDSHLVLITPRSHEPDDKSFSFYWLWNSNLDYKWTFRIDLIEIIWKNVVTIQI